MAHSKGLLAKAPIAKLAAAAVSTEYARLHLFHGTLEREL
jgi:hypothetical protein